MGVKICSMCKVEKPHTQYTMRKNKGRRYPMTYCKPCYAQYEMGRRKKYQEIYHSIAKKHRDSNKETVLLRTALWRIKNHELALKLTRNWRKENRGYINSYQNKCRAEKLMATPVWANHFFIGEIYHLAALRTKALKRRFEVDHIVPLRSPLVCGLHNEFNLRVVPKEVNIEKSNRHWPDMPNG